ncbi:GntR family transcriptional regulator [Streptomyces sp. NRRL B-24572]|uniref:GntR family transcriptional regulator n=1 Tax=Streptomyces sp. NRRL B-24572 TaxID=1962156 RepID=UPI0015C50DB6|nr:GntR family transcriptional regulator [Streptomyces sp. NRRL B-24572]
METGRVQVQVTPGEVSAIRDWVRLSCPEPGKHLPAVGKIAEELSTSSGVVRSALEQLAEEGVVTLHEGYRLYSVGTMTPTEAAYRALRTWLVRMFRPGERFLSQHDMGRLFKYGVKEVTGACGRLVEEGYLKGGRSGYFVAHYHPSVQLARAQILRERAEELRSEADVLVALAEEAEQRLPADTPMPDWGVGAS